MAATQELDDALSRFHDALAKGSLAADKANEVLLRLARILVPINYTREARFRHDPAFTVPPARQSRSLPNCLRSRPRSAASGLRRPYADKTG